MKQPKKSAIAVKKRHTVKELVMSSPHQEIVYISPVFGGRTHDYTMLKTAFDPEQDWFLHVTARADLGFLGFGEDYSNISSIMLPHTTPRQSKNNPNPTLTQNQKKENRKHAQLRIAVEHAIGGMKHMYCLVHRIRNHSNSIVDQFFGLSAGLWNFRIS